MQFSQTLTLSHTMAVMRLKSEASKLVLSYLWWVIEPLLYVTVFYIVFEKLLSRGGGDFLVFLMLGKIPFLWFSKSINTAANAMLTGKGIMGQRDFPKHIFPYSVVLEASYKQVVVFLLLFFWLFTQGYSLSQACLWLPLLILSNLSLILSGSMLAALRVVYLQDLRAVIGMGTLFLMFASGIFWDVRSIADPEVQQLILTFNPLAFLLDAYRQILMHQTSPDISYLLVLTFLSLVLLGLVHWVYARQSQYIAYKVLS